jgi:dTDP-4-dehydrorhamnose 3,5-epimerase
MKLIKTRLEGLFIIEPEVYKDERGYFFESYNREKFLEIGLDFKFVQDNESKSAKGVLRGLHFQVPPHEQGKLVRVIKGAALDVAVDLRKNSPTYGQWDSVELSEKNKLMYWIPAGFAHGFLTLEEDTIFFYKCTAVYHKQSERSIAWNDNELNINWGTTNPFLSEKDKINQGFGEFISPF